MMKLTQSCNSLFAISVIVVIQDDQFNMSLHSIIAEVLPLRAVFQQQGMEDFQ